MGGELTRPEPGYKLRNKMLYGNGIFKTEFARVIRIDVTYACCRSKL